MCKLKTTFDELRLFQWYWSQAAECLTQPLFFLVLLGLVKRSIWDPLVRALWVPVRLPRLVWINSSCGYAIVRRSSRSLPGFGASLPIAWSHPTLAGIKLVIRCFTASYLCYLCKLFCSWPTVVKIGPSLYRQQFRYLSSGIQSLVVTTGFFITHPSTLFNLLLFSTITHFCFVL
jgi:hypothetical protein